MCHDEYPTPPTTRFLIAFGKSYFEHYDYLLPTKLIEHADVVFAIEANMSVHVVKIRHSTNLFDLLKADREGNIKTLSQGKTLTQLSETNWKLFRESCVYP